jgi:hypothetical protein
MRFTQRELITKDTNYRFQGRRCECGGRLWFDGLVLVCENIVYEKDNEEDRPVIVSECCYMLATG